MKKYKKDPFICSICKLELPFDDLRIEWTNKGRVNFCHTECSEGYNDSPNIIFDIFGEFMFSCPALVYESLNKRYEEYGNTDFLSI